MLLNNFYDVSQAWPTDRRSDVNPDIMLNVSPYNSRSGSYLLARPKQEEYKVIPEVTTMTHVHFCFHVEQLQKLLIVSLELLVSLSMQFLFHYMHVFVCL